MTPLLVALGAGVGAMLRFALSTHLDRPDFPLGTWAANVAGSFALGLISALVVGPDTLALLGVGLCGGFTTYSSFAVQAYDRGPRLGTAYVVATLVSALAACAAGFALGALLS